MSESNQNNNTVNITEEDVSDVLDQMGLNVHQIMSDDATKQEKVINPVKIQENRNERFKSAQWFEDIRHTSISIFGLGGIGSWTALLVSRFNPSVMTLMDGDIYDFSNLSGQFCKLEDVSVSKVEATQNNIARFSGYYKANTFTENVTRETNLVMFQDIVITGFDNMEARKIVFEKWMSSPSKVLIDGRLAAEKLQIYCICKDDEYHINEYKNNALFDDREATPEICSYKQTSHMASMIASFICNLITNYIEVSKVEFIRELPYFIEYNAITMQLTKN